MQDEEKKKESFIDKVTGFIKRIFSSKTRVAVIFGILFVLVFLVNGYKATQKANSQEELGTEETGSTEEVSDYTYTEGEEPDENSDIYLLSIQPDLIKSYGTLPDGYIWDLEGNLFSLGDTSMSAEEVVYAYLNGIRSLDMSMAQKYSRGSSVVNTFEGYFDSTDTDIDYNDSFLRNMYKEVLLSIQIQGILDTTVFADNKQVFTVKLNILDLANKDFWLKDKYKIYNDLYIYSSDEDDSTKSEMYLYDYILDYYRSEESSTKDVTVNLTLQRYPDLKTGWLVSIDKDIDDMCNYSDGTLMVNYMQEMYIEEGYEYIRQQRLSSTTEALPDLEDINKPNKNKKKSKKKETTTQKQENIDAEETE